jgi:RNA polymerase sigma-B factor
VTANYRRDEIQALADEWVRAKEKDRRAIEERLVIEADHLITAIAVRFIHRGEPIEDIKQVAFVALIASLRRYDPSTGSAFCSYGGACVTGAIRNHFRDNTWALKVPRGEQDLAASYWSMCDRAGGVDIPIGEAAATLGVEAHYLARALSASTAWRARDLLDSDPVPQSDAASGNPEDIVESDLLTKELLEGLSESERRLVWGRFVDGRTQAEIAKDVGLTPMQASRALKSAMSKLREKASVLGLQHA